MLYIFLMVHIWLQRTASSSSLGSTSGNPTEVKQEKNSSLIDFDSDPEPLMVAPSQAQPTLQTTPQPTSSTADDNWASFDAVPEAKVSQPPAIMNSLDILSQLSVPASASQLSGGVNPPSSSSVLPIVGSSTFPPPGNSPIMQLTPGVATIMPSSALSTFPHGGAPATVPGLNLALPSNGGIPNGMQPHQPSSFRVSGVHSAHQSSIPVSSAPQGQVGLRKMLILYSIFFSCLLTIECNLIICFLDFLIALECT